MYEKCPICEDKYTENDRKVLYHIEYTPKAITTYTCRGCNFAEDLIQHPERESILNPDHKYHMEHRKEIVRAWTLKNRNLINKF